MTITALSGPIIQFGITLSSTSGDGIGGQDYEHNSQRAPQVTDLGDSMMDPRSAYNYDPGSGVTAKTFAFFNNVGQVDFVPATANASAFVTAATVTTGIVGAFTLAAASSANGTYLTTIIAPETGKATGNLVAIDSTAAFLSLGSDATVNLWNPGAGTGRTISITTSSSGDLGTWSVAGRDMYGYKVTEQIALSQGTTNSSGYTIKGKKAFKYVSSITNATTPTSTGVSIGFADTFGFPLTVPYTGQNAGVQLLASAYSSAVVVALSSASVALASTVATQTSTTPDVRGTYASTTASNATLRVQMLVTPSASAIASISVTNVAPLLGGTQFSSV
jgi:hypothetical protein